VSAAPGVDRIPPRLGALHFYQLPIAAPKPVAGREFDATGASRGATCTPLPRLVWTTKAAGYHFDRFQNLRLTEAETDELVEYLKSI
jgi:hypothetical protein